jgi:hypothetical protein
MCKRRQRSGYLRIFRRSPGGVSTAKYLTPEAGPQAFVAYLGPESRVWWDRLNRFWDGELQPE